MFDSSSQTVLVQVSGPDRPGISAGLLSILAAAEAAVHDIEQVVIRGRLTLGLLVDVPSGRDLLKELLVFAWEHDLQVEFDVAEGPPEPVRAGWAVTLLGPELSPLELHAATSAIAEGGGNIGRIVQLSRYPVVSYELLVHGGGFDEIRDNLIVAASNHPGLDVAIQREGLGRRAKRLVVVDVDSTLVQDEVIDLLADEAGTRAEVEQITARAMSGELEFEAALRERVQHLAGLDTDALERAWSRLRLTPGARTFIRTLRRMGFRTAIVSGGFRWFTERLRKDLGIDHAFANHLEAVDGRLTGKLIGPVIDRRRKAEILVEVAELEGISLDQTVAIGDGANDLDMLGAAGLGIAFCAKPLVQEGPTPLYGSRTSTPFCLCWACAATTSNKPTPTTPTEPRPVAT